MTGPLRFHDALYIAFLAGIIRRTHFVSSTFCCNGTGSRVGCRLRPYQCSRSAIRKALRYEIDAV